MERRAGFPVPTSLDGDTGQEPRLWESQKEYEKPVNGGERRDGQLLWLPTSHGDPDATQKLWQGNRRLQILQGRQTIVCQFLFERFQLQSESHTPEFLPMRTKMRPYLQTALHDLHHNRLQQVTQSGQDHCGRTGMLHELQSDIQSHFHLC